MNFFKDGLSIDEAKLSTIMVLLIVFSSIGVYTIFQFGDLPMNLTNLLYALIAAVTGVNMVKFGASYVKNKQDQNIQVEAEIEYRQRGDCFDEIINTTDEEKPLI